MRKQVCLLLVSGLLFTSGCSLFGTGETNIEPVNKGITTGELQVDENKNKTVPMGTTNGNKDSGVVQGGNALFATPTPSTEIIATVTPQPASSENKEKSAVLALSDNPLGSSIILYYQDAEGSIVPMSRKVEKLEGIAKAAINGLIDTAITREEIEYYGVYPVIPQGTQLSGINVVNGIAIIDFNSKITNYKTEAAERNMVASIVYTATQFKTIKGVKLWIDGKPVNKLKFNTDLSGVLSRQNVLINSPRLNMNTEMGKTDIYLIKSANENHSYAIPVSIEHPRITSDLIPSKIVELLAQNYSSRKLYSALPQKTKLVGSSVKGKVLTLDFNSEVRNFSGNANEEALIKQLLYSMKQVEGVEKLRILINGKDAVLPEGTELVGDITIPEIRNTLIEVQEE